MTTTFLRIAAIGVAIAGAAPVFAQSPPPPMPPGAPSGPGGYAAPRGMHAMPGHGGGMMGKRAFASLSEAGRATMTEAFRAGGDRKADRQAVKAARDRMLAVLDGDRLDVAALKRAMNDERSAANTSRERAQAALLAGFTKLSAADRKAFVADARSLKSRMEGRMRDWRGRRGDDDMPPPM